MLIGQVWSLVFVFIGITVLVIIDDFRKILALKNINKEVTVLRNKLEVAQRENNSIPDLRKKYDNEIKCLKEKLHKFESSPQCERSSDTISTMD
jgi:hypothetical protein